MLRRVLCIAWVGVCLCVSAAYNVRRPGESLYPRWSGAKIGQWTLDFQAAKDAAQMDRKNRIVMTTGSWWCPYCEALEEKVLSSDRWKQFVEEEGYYLSMLDFPYRGTVKEEEVGKCLHPEFGEGWGFKCWLYDENYLSANGLSVADGLAAIEKLYEIQGMLALPSASKVKIRSWDGSSDIVYGRVGYPTLIVYLWDGREAGRFSPIVNSMSESDAVEYVIAKIRMLRNEALSLDCGLCHDEVQSAFQGDRAGRFCGWLTDVDGAIAGVFNLRVGKRNVQGLMSFSATFTIGGKRTTLTGKTNTCESAVLLTSKRAASGDYATFRVLHHGLSGECTIEGVHYGVQGAWDDFSSRAEDSVERRKSAGSGIWSLVLVPTNSVTAWNRAYGALSVALDAKGRGRISGTLGDGTRVKTTASLIVGDNGISCLPASLDLYKAHSGGLGFVLWFKEGYLFNVTAVRPWRCPTTGRAFESGWYPLYTADSGIGDVGVEMELNIGDMPLEIKGAPVVRSPNYDVVDTSSAKWKGTAQSSFRGLLSRKTGLVAGTLKFPVLKTGGKTQLISGKVAAAVVGGTAYGSVLIPNEGAWAVKLSACGACEE